MNTTYTNIYTNPYINDVKKTAQVFLSFLLITIVCIAVLTAFYMIAAPDESIKVHASAGVLIGYSIGFVIWFISTNNSELIKTSTRLFRDIQTIVAIGLGVMAFFATLLAVGNFQIWL